MNREIQLTQSEIHSPDGQKIHLSYEQETDTLDIFFGENEAATGIELTSQILLRVNLQTKRAVSLTIRHFSILAEHTEYGPRSYQLESLTKMPDDPREMILSLLTSAPVNQFLELTHFQNAPNERIPFTYVKSRPLLAA